MASKKQNKRYVLKYRIDSRKKYFIMQKCRLEQ